MGRRSFHEWHGLWIGHSNHHSGEDYNLATALRQGKTSSAARGALASSLISHASMLARRCSACFRPTLTAAPIALSHCRVRCRHPAAAGGLAILPPAGGARVPPACVCGPCAAQYPVHVLDPHGPRGAAAAPKALRGAAQHAEPPPRAPPTARQLQLRRFPHRLGSPLRDFHSRGSVRVTMASLFSS